VRCELSPLAEADLLEIGDYIAQDNPRRAESFVDELVEQAEKITRMPSGYTVREDLAPGLAHVRARAIHPLLSDHRP
jgi:toxin ParE1/3/4